MKRNLLLIIVVLIVVGVVAVSGVGFGKAMKYYGILAGVSLVMCLVSGLFLKHVVALRKFPIVIGMPRIFGIAALVFGLVHGGSAFFGQFGGFSGVAYLPNVYWWPIGLGVAMLLIMFGVLFHKKLKWMLYIVGVLLVFHVLIIGSDFVKLTNLSIHGRHATQMEGVASHSNMNVGMNMSMPIVTGQGRYNVSFLHPDLVMSGVQVPLRFKVFDAGTGNEISLFSMSYDKLMHMIVVDESLEYFAHIHPSLDMDKGFLIEHAFPHAGRYHVYVNFVPLGEKVEQQFGFSLQVGGKELLKKIGFDSEIKSKQFEFFDISWSSTLPLSANKMSAGQQPIWFTVKKDGKDFADIHPYLAAFGHLTMVNTKTFAFVHVHPKQSQRLTVDSRSGPTVEFLPMSYYNNIEPGDYRMFGQFNLGGKTITSSFDVTIAP